MTPILHKIKQNRYRRLSQVISRRIDRENPARKKWRAVRVVVGFILAMTSTLRMGDNQWLFFCVSLVGLYLVIDEVRRLRTKPPRIRWRDALRESGVGVAILFIMTLAVYFDSPDTILATLVCSLFAASTLLLLAVFIYACLQFRRVKREIEEEKDLIRRREARRKKMSML